ncbi:MULTISPECIES: cupin domain-containing protein [unclassified Pseudovibrio]|uniref:cupin domain-containing protein n=1 Tax=unclassified Pseudovibrio TaxID=2627060 RepID=UPI0007AE679A|nr:MULTISPECIES: cupin domain-containing protein [unclassified Pseudovibrio]KZK98046.1 Ethanolamine utilization protein EutQ [Pseudovibrio sp. W74]KZL05269.1 Ethanolamine utilization protein EutQ [Pseudovibrio sp. Ad14]
MSARVIKAADVEMTHRGGPPGIARVGRAISPDLSPSMAAGFAEFDGCEVEWTVLYDEIVYVIEGEFRLGTKDGELTAQAGDVMWIPEGTSLVYRGTKARIFYTVHPGNWKDRLAE